MRELGGGRCSDVTHDRDWIMRGRIELSVRYLELRRTLGRQ
jgi:hypothetical protein